MGSEFGNDLVPTTVLFVSTSLPVRLLTGSAAVVHTATASAQLGTGIATAQGVADVFVRHEMNILSNFKLYSSRYFVNPSTPLTSLHCCNEYHTVDLGVSFCFEAHPVRERERNRSDDDVNP